MRRLALVALFAAFAARGADKPELIVVVSVDQLRFDFIDRFEPWLTTRGFKRFTREGAYYPNARFTHGIASTGPGHAVIGTGRPPSENGIIGNTWFERDAPVDERRWQAYFDDVIPYGTRAAPASGRPWWRQGGSPRYCVDGLSPSQLTVSSPFDDLHVISVSHKDTSAILMGGRGAESAYWFDYRLPGFVSSSHYRANSAVLKFNDLVSGYLPGSKQWNALAGDFREVTFDPPAAWPLKNDRYGATFPHAVSDARGVIYSPFGHELILDFALHVLSVETPDVLFVGVSSTDNLGHYYGPDSLEVADSMVRLDRALAAFLDALERRFSERVTVALTSDHGVQATPEIVKLRDPKADVGRVDLRNPHPDARLLRDLPPARIAIERDAARQLGIAFSENAPLTHALTYFFIESMLYLNWPRIAELKLDGERVKRAVRGAAARLEGVSGAWTNGELAAGGGGATPMRASYHPDRGGDVYLALRLGWIWHWGSNSTTHGQPVDDDLRVPLMLWGAGVKPGHYDAAVSPGDLARMLSGGATTISRTAALTSPSPRCAGSPRSRLSPLPRRGCARSAPPRSDTRD